MFKLIIFDRLDCSRSIEVLLNPERTEIMSEYGVNFRVEDGLLQVHLSGTFPKELLDTGQNLFQPLIDACVSQKCDKVLIDARELKVDLDTVGLFRAGEDIVAMTRMGFRTALLAREDMIDRFFEDVAVNRGGDVKVFTHLSSALDWLREQ